MHDRDDSRRANDDGCHQPDQHRLSLPRHVHAEEHTPPRPVPVVRDPQRAPDIPGDFERC
jgi:hypothetical protein